MDITVDGVKLEHSIGDKPYYISFDEDGWTPKIKEARYDSVNEIHISKKGVKYLNSDGTEINGKDKGVFWTKEEAEIWFKENIPEKLLYQPNDEAFYVEDGKIHTMYADMLDGLAVADGKLVYVFWDNHKSLFVNEEREITYINDKRIEPMPAYDTYKEAKKALNEKEME